MTTGTGMINLQATLSASSAMPPPVDGTPGWHHPCTCPTTLRYDEDGRFSCEHTTVEPGDRRTQYCVDHSVALLLIEQARNL